MSRESRLRDQLRNLDRMIQAERDPRKRARFEDWRRQVQATLEGKDMSDKKKFKWAKGQTRVVGEDHARPRPIRMIDVSPEAQKQFTRVVVTRPGGQQTEFEPQVVATVCRFLLEHSGQELKLKGKTHVEKWDALAEKFGMAPNVLGILFRALERKGVIEVPEPHKRHVYVVTAKGRELIGAACSKALKEAA